MLARFRVLVVVVLALVSTPAPAHPQQATSNASSATPSAGGPRLELTATAVRRAMQVSDNSMMARRRQSAGKPAALMIVGGAAVILGAIIGDAIGTLFMIGGAVAFLYGLFLYLE